jgi:hypothetical protein
VLFASLASSSLHYGADLWDVGASVCSAQSEGARASLARLARFLKDKAELDRTYARDLKKVDDAAAAADEAAREEAATARDEDGAAADHPPADIESSPYSSCSSSLSLWLPMPCGV